MAADSIGFCAGYFSGMGSICKDEKRIKGRENGPKEEGLEANAEGEGLPILQAGGGHGAAGV